MVMNMQVSNRIREYRKKKHLSQKQLAELLHVHQTAISQWENGKTEPDIAKMEKLSEILGASIDRLMCVKQEEPVRFDGPREEVADIMTGLSPDEIQRVRDFVSGIKASRAK